jgi:EAL domain-containing protein (putative c-di-GMP-specific phosphodiesterase class I)/CheY-like chemotaxis protein
MRAAGGRATDHPVYQKCADSHTGGRDNLPTLCPPVATFEIAVLRQLSVLVVEDHDFQREMIVAILQRLNAREIHSAADGQSALDVLAKSNVDLIVSDIDMPGVDGLELTRLLAHSRYAGSVIIVSAIEPALLSATEAMAKAYGIRLLGVISKPVTRAALARLIVRHAPNAANQASKPEAPFSIKEILGALQADQIEPFFQPKVDLVTARVVGAEALARWRHPKLGIIPPSRFIQQLEDAGKIDDLMWVMLKKGAAFCGTLNATGVESSVAINLSLRSLNNAQLSTRISEVTKMHGVNPASVCLEMTESAATTDLATALENLTRLRMRGFKLSIDDFGTGYASMQQLTRIPFTELKIDRTFVANAATNEAARVVLKSSLQLARDLNIYAVAEGVETKEQWDFLQELGCSHAQGYYIAKPMEAAAYLRWMRSLARDATSVFFATESPQLYKTQV